MEAADWARVLNLGLCLLCLALLGRKYYKYWDRYSVRTKDFWWVLLIWTIAVAYGTMEQLGWSFFGDIRPVLVTLALILSVKLLLKPNEADHPTFSREF